MAKRLKYRLRSVKNGWQVQARTWFFFWMNVGPVYSNYDKAEIAVKMANYSN